MECRECGMAMPQKVDACPFCGAAVPSAASPPKPSLIQGINGCVLAYFWLQVALVLIAVLAIALAIAFPLLARLFGGH